MPSFGDKLYKIRNELVNKLTLNELESLSLMLKREVRIRIRREEFEKKREAKIMEKKTLEAKIKEEQMRLMGLSEEKRKRDIKLAKVRRQVKEADEEINNILGLSEVKQTYSSEEWIEFFIDKITENKK
tara:strand:+ start:131 stop:517 length:387 start_codon:yes stop_codon:yes gene_type:complete